jgi:hypothetical protein
VDSPFIDFGPSTSFPDPQRSEDYCSPGASLGENPFINVSSFLWQQASSSHLLGLAHSIPSHYHFKTKDQKNTSPTYPTQKDQKNTSPTYPTPKDQKNVPSTNYNIDPIPFTTDILLSSNESASPPPSLNASGQVSLYTTPGNDTTFIQSFTGPSRMHLSQPKLLGSYPHSETTATPR